jgi:transcriptional regulator with XRE-family HTH domain
MPTQVKAKADQGAQLRWRSVREAQGLTLREAARRAEIHVAHLSRFERGKAGLGMEALARLAKVLGLRELDRLLAPYRGGGKSRVKGSGP